MPAVSEEVLALADDNMRRTWLAVTTNAPRPEHVTDDDVLLISSGLPVALFNPSFVTRPPSDPAALVARVREHYAARSSPYVLYFRDAVAPGLADACAAAGMVEHFQPPLMVLDPIPPPEGPGPAGLRIDAVETSNIDGYAHVLAEGFGMPRSIVDQLLGAPLLEVPNFIGFLGSIEGEPVASSGVFVTETVAGVYNVATLAEHRGKGIGAAITWAAARAGAAVGATRSILQSSDKGAPVYTRMGYATPARYRQFEPAPR